MKPILLSNQSTLMEQKKTFGLPLSLGYVLAVCIPLFLLSACTLLPERLRGGTPPATPPPTEKLSVNVPPATSSPTDKTIAPASPVPTRSSLSSPTLIPAGVESEAVLQAVALQPAYQADLQALQDLTRYDIQVDLDYDASTFLGHETVIYTNTEEVSLDSLYFRLLPNGGRSYGDGSLTASGLTQDGQPVETTLSLDDSVLEVKLANPLDPGEQTRIEMDFVGQVPEDFGGEGYGIYNFSQGVLALSGWYPILAVYDDEGWNLDPTSAIGDSVYSDMAYYTVALTAPSDQVVAATGVEVDRQNQGGKDLIRYASGPAREFFLVASPEFEVVSETREGTTVNSYYLPGSERGGQNALDVAQDSLRTFNDKFGSYPYTELDIIQAPMENAAGVEFPGIVLITEKYYTDDRRDFFTTTIAHEVAHQWWYNLVGNDVFDAPWQDEALATFSSALYWEAAQGLGGYEGIMDYYEQQYNRYLQENRDDLITGSLAHYEALPNGGGYGPVVYRKGALFFRALRAEIGDEAFFKALKSYYETFKYKIADPQDLLAAFESAAGRQLDDFYNEWLYSAKP